MKVFLFTGTAFAILAVVASASRWLSRYDPKQPCDSLKDGAYSLPDVFSYLLCSYEQPEIKLCQEEYLFAPEAQKCKDGKYTNLRNFCEHRSNGNYRHPWNCHQFIICLNHQLHEFNCSTENLVYNPYIDKCEEPSAFKCKQIVHPGSTNSPCEGLADGNIALRDVFQYMTCKENVATYTTCPKHTIYDPKENNCVLLKKVDKEQFCTHRSSSNWRNPWDCHGFVSCSNGLNYFMKCAPNVPPLVYNPKLDHCVGHVEFECKQEPKHIKFESNLLAANPCASRADGKYPIRDIFRYLTCKNHIPSYTSCKPNYIYEPGQKACVSIATQSVWYFCENRTNGNWVNPWNCHRYFVCKNGANKNTPCILNYLNYNPYQDACVDPSDYPCHQVASGISAQSLCFNRANGNYTIPDVFAYVRCIGQKDQIVNCTEGDIFYPDTRTCKPAASTTKTNFCVYHKAGLYRDPWDCHAFAECIDEHFHAYNCCSGVYNPYTYQCESAYPCKQVKTNQLSLNDPCASLKDGDYAIRDVFKYLTCKSSKATYNTCPVKTIFEPRTHECIDISTQSEETFCANRSNGDWVNPWNCHHFFKCFYGVTHGFQCQFSNLNYDPYSDACVYPSQYGCHQVFPKISYYDPKNPCEDLADGDYVIRDVFAYLQCKDHKNKTVTCPDGDIFDPISKKCQDGSKTTFKTFCKGRQTENYRDPWNCHKYIVCVHGVPVAFNCSTSALVYDPYNDLCENPSNFSCKQLKTKKLLSADPCALLKDGDYAIRDVFKYMTCKSSKATYKACPHKAIFEPGTRECVDISTQSEETFCTNRSNGDWANPWNCHLFFKCFYGVTHNFQCQFSNLNYDPYSDACVYPSQYGCHQISPKLTADPCAALKDGDYAIRDVFKYMVCKNGKSTYKTCPNNTIFQPETDECANISTVTNETFCRYRSNGDWANPWNCHHFYKCLNWYAYDFACQFNGLNYDPYVDACVYPAQYGCHQVSHKCIGDSKNPCESRGDGNYIITDVFAYLECKSDVAKYVSCETGNVFDVHTKKCINGSKIDKVHFCNGRTNGNYRNPWDCHSFVSCNGDVFHERQCPTKVLVYDPYKDLCEYPTKFKCTQLKKTKLLAADPCASLKDGDYAIRDVFKYMTCKGGKGSYNSCPYQDIYDPGKHECVSIATQSITGFCADRKSGDWVNPWNCHQYFVCTNQVTMTYSCLINGFTYDPYNDVCVLPKDYGCKQVQTMLSNPSPDKGISTPYNKPEIHDICTTLPDGNYATRDVFSILQCKNHSSHNVECAPGFIYIPGNTNCTNASKVDEKHFCINRMDGNWRDPWNCHNYYTCHAGQQFNRKCSPFAATLTYDPAKDTCEYEYILPCKNLTKSADESQIAVSTKKRDTNNMQVKDTKDPCAALEDGVYAIRDVFSYMLCHNQHHHYIPCSYGKIFVAQSKTCKNAKNVTLDDFCVGRPNGNWRNPWNCHNYITCDAFRTFDRKCSILTTLNYDPYNDLCQYPYDYPCRNLTKAAGKSQTSVSTKKIDTNDIQVKDTKDPCAALEDGIYAIRDVFSYMLCHSHHHHYIPCSLGKIFVYQSKRCQSAKKMKIDNFCIHRPNGNWRNPWNCHNYITCDAFRTFDRKCSILTTLNYDPYNDLCEYPYNYPCRNLTISDSNAQESACSGLDDGQYAIADVFKYMICKNNQYSYQSCPPGRLYSQSTRRCVKGSSVTFDNFCFGRYVKNWRNPWDCHSYIVCVGRPIKLECPSGLVFDPYYNECVYAYQFHCNVIGSKHAVKEIWEDPWM